jgi:hypothetical protein
MQVTFTLEEAKSLVGLIDLAVKTGGLGVAETAVYFAKKLETAAKEEQDTSSTVTRNHMSNGADAHSTPP